MRCNRNSSVGGCVGGRWRSGAYRAPPEVLARTSNAETWGRQLPDGKLPASVTYMLRKHQNMSMLVGWLNLVRERAPSTPTRHIRRSGVDRHGFGEKMTLAIKLVNLTHYRECVAGRIPWIEAQILSSACIV